MQVRPATLKPTNVVAISLHYTDRSGILFSNDPSNAALKSQLLSNLHQIAPNAIVPVDNLDTVVVIAYVSFTQRDITTNEHIENCQGFCDEQGWIFAPHVLADTQNNNLTNTATKDGNTQERNFNRKQIDTLAYQLEHVRKKFPDSLIQFLFLNDHAHKHKPLRPTADHFKHNVPENCTLELHQCISTTRLALHKRDGVTKFDKVPDIDVTCKFHLPHEVSFDPLSLSHEDSKILNELLLACVKEGTEVFEPNKSYPATLAGPHHTQQRKKFKLTNEHIKLLYFRPSATSSYGYRFEMVSKTALGKGTFGQVFDGAGTLVPQNDGSLMAKMIPAALQRVHKLSSYAPNKIGLTSTVQRLLHQNIVSCHAPHLHTKAITFHLSGSQLTSLTAMRKMHGCHLWKLLKTEPLNGDNSISHALDILRAYRKQIVLNKLIHGDIKPDNVIITANKAHFIDYDAGKILSEHDDRKTGALGYQAPEVSQKNAHGSTQQSDIFSLGLTIGEIFGDVHEVGIRLILELTFKRQNDLTAEERRMISDCIANLTHPDSSKRGAIDDAIRVFEQMTLKRSGCSPHIQTYYDQAVTFDQSFHSQFAGKPSTPDNIVAFLDGFMNDVSQLLPDISPETPAAIKTFIARVIDIQLINEYHNRQELIAITNQLRVDYQQIFGDITAKLSLLNQALEDNNILHSDLPKDIVNQARQFMDHVQKKLCARSEKYPLSLDNIKLICAKSKKEQKQLFEYLSYFSRLRNNRANFYRSDFGRLFKLLVVERKPIISNQPVEMLAVSPATVSSALSVCSYIETETDTYTVSRPE